MNAVVKSKVGEVANDQPPKLPTLAEFRAQRQRNVEPALPEPWLKYPDLMDWRNWRRNSNRMYEMLPTSISDEVLAQAAADCAAYMEPVTMEEAVAGDRLLRNRFPDWEKLGPDEMKGLTLMWGESFVGFPRVLFHEAIKRWFNNPKAKRAPIPGELKDEVAKDYREAKDFAFKIEQALTWLEDMRTEPRVVLMECSHSLEHWEREAEFASKELAAEEAKERPWMIDEKRSAAKRAEQQVEAWKAEAKAQAARFGFKGELPKHDYRLMQQLTEKLKATREAREAREAYDAVSLAASHTGANGIRPMVAAG